MTERGMINYTLTHLPLAWSRLRGTHPCIALIRAVTFYEREHQARMHAAPPSTHFFWSAALELESCDGLKANNKKTGFTSRILVVDIF